MSAGTPLPWRISSRSSFRVYGNGSGPYAANTIRAQDATYIVTACNAYPKLVSDRARLIAALRKAIAEADGWSDECRGVPAENLSAERTLLANLDASGGA